MDKRCQCKEQQISGPFFIYSRVYGKQTKCGCHTLLDRRKREGVKSRGEHKEYAENHRARVFANKVNVGNNCGESVEHKQVLKSEIQGLEQAVNECKSYSVGKIR